MTTKKVIERNLPFTNKYKLVGITRQTLTDIDAMVTICDNCNASIVNIANIIDNHGKTFNVGLDCLKTLVGSLADLQNANDKVFDFNCALRFYQRMEKAEKVLFRGDFIVIYYRNKDNPNFLEFAQDFELKYKDFNFDLDKFRRELTVKEKTIETLLVEIQNGYVYSYKEYDKDYRIEKKNHNKFGLFQNDKLFNHIELDTVERILNRVISDRF